MAIKHKDQVTTACGTPFDVSEQNPAVYTLYKNKIIYFCEEECRVEFEEDLQKFLESDHFKIKLEMLEEIPRDEYTGNS